MLNFAHKQRPLAAPRHLTVSAKREILAEWNRVRSQSMRGVGSPDPAILPWCDLINELSGVCTLQSCAGHVHDGIYETAHLWLWLSPDLDSEFQRCVYELVARERYIDRVMKLYMADGKEIVSIYFYGAERDCLEPSMSVIYNFLAGISAKCLRRNLYFVL